MIGQSGIRLDRTKSSTNGTHGLFLIKEQPFGFFKAACDLNTLKQWSDSGRCFILKNYLLVFLSLSYQK